jgi:hypothetical protein
LERSGHGCLKRGTAEFRDYCSELGFTETSCSSQRGSLGAYLCGLATSLDFVVYDSPGICDTTPILFHLPHPIWTFLFISSIIRHADG